MNGSDDINANNHPKNSGINAREKYLEVLNSCLTNPNKLPSSVLEGWYKVYRKAINDPRNREELLYYYDAYLKNNEEILTNDILEVWYNKYIWPMYYPDENPINNEKKGIYCSLLNFFRSRH